MPYAHCDACGKSQYECVCRSTCDVCGIRTNHTTKQHEAELQAALLCVDCGQPHGWDDDEARRCQECLIEYREVRAEWAREAAEELSKQASYYTPDEGGQG